MSTSEHLLIRQAYRRITLLQYSPYEADDERKCYIPTKGFPRSLRKPMMSMGWVRGILWKTPSKMIFVYFHHLTVWDEPPTPLTNACPYPNVVPRQPPDFVVGHPAVRLLRKRPASWATDAWFLSREFLDGLPNRDAVLPQLTRLGWKKSTRLTPGGGAITGLFKPLIPEREQVPVNTDQLTAFRRTTTRPRGVLCPQPERRYYEHNTD